MAEVEAAASRLLQDAMAAFKTGDEEDARAIVAAYKQEIAAACDGVIRAIVSGQAADLAGADAASVALYVRWLKRIAAHARNVASSLANPLPRLPGRNRPPGEGRVLG